MVKVGYPITGGTNRILEHFRVITVNMAYNLFYYTYILLKWKRREISFPLKQSDGLFFVSTIEK